MEVPDVEKARQLFQRNGLGFPEIPGELAALLKERHRWSFSTRPIKMSPYNLHHYVEEAESGPVDDYAILDHSGHGANSYAIHYSLVQGPLRMFLQLSWGGLYGDSEKDAAQIRDCLSIADKIVAAQKVGTLQAGEHLTIVASDFYGCYWLPPGGSSRDDDLSRRGSLDLRPRTALAQAPVG